MIKNKNGTWIFFPLPKPPDHAVESFVRKAMQDPGVDPNGCYLSQWDEEKKKEVNYLVGSEKTADGAMK